MVFYACFPPRRPASALKALSATPTRGVTDKFPMLNDVSRKEVRRWATELMAELKPATVQRMMTDCRTYWAYLATIEAVPEESAPFDRLGLKVKSTPRIANMAVDG